MPAVSLPAACLRCGSDRLTWTISANELAHAECGGCTDDYRVAPDGDGWRMVSSRFQRMADFQDLLRRQGARDVRRAEHEADLIDPR